MDTVKVIKCKGLLASELMKVLHVESVRRILVVTGRNLYESSGAKKTLTSVFDEYSIAFFRYSNPNPRIEDIADCLELARKHSPQIIIGLGGGTAMDIAKITHALVSHVDDPCEYITKSKFLSNPPTQLLILVPTTTGTGSEITQFAVAYIKGRKYSLDHEFLRADYCFLDSELTLSLSPKLVAITAFDALSQAVESYWSLNSTSESRSYAKKALQLLKDNLPLVSENARIDVRDNLLMASHLSGKAIDITRTTAAHAISYGLTSHYGLPHGLAVILTLPSFMVFNQGVDSESNQDARGVDYVRDTLGDIAAILGFEAIEECSTWIQEMLETFGFQMRLRNYGVTRKDIDENIIPSYNEERGRNNPRRVTKRDLKAILMDVW